MEPSTPRPALITDDLTESKRKKRKTSKYEKKDRSRLQYILAKYRKLQKKLLDGGCIEDPDPYVETYIFYCFKGELVD